MVRRRCKREGCRRTRAAGKTHCTQVCSLLDIELSTLESVCRFAGPGALSTEAWTRLVGLADAWSEYVKARGELDQFVKRQTTG
jgi:hypothetical protein